MFNLVQLLLCGLFNRFVGDFQPNFNLSLQYIHYSSSIWMYSRVPLASASCFVESVRLIGTCESLLVCSASSIEFTRFSWAVSKRFWMPTSPFCALPMCWRRLSHWMIWDIASTTGSSLPFVATAWFLVCPLVNERGRSAVRCIEILITHGETVGFNSILLSCALVLARKWKQEQERGSIVEHRSHFLWCAHTTKRLEQSSSSVNNVLQVRKLHGFISLQLQQLNRWQREQWRWSQRQWW